MAGQRLFTRRSFLKTSVAVVTLGALGGCSAPAAPAPAPAAPAPAAPTVAPAAAPAKPAAGQIVLRFGSVQAPGSSNIKAMELFGDELAKLSGGQFKVEVYPSSQLGGVGESLQAIQLGTQQMEVGNPASSAPFVKEMDVLSLLFLSASREKLFAAVDGEFGKRMGGFTEKAGLTTLAWWDAAPRHFFNNKRPINTPDDLKGLKIRVIESPVWVKSMQAMGANPVAMDFKELFSALQSNVIDGYEGIVTDADKNGLFQVVKYLSLSAHLFDIYTVYIGKKLFDGFTPEQQKMVTQAMKTATEFQRKTQAADVLESEKKLRGVMQVNDVSEANRKLFVEKVRAVYKDFEQTLGKDLIDEAAKALG